MKVTMKVQISGTRNGETWPSVGELLTVSDREGAELCGQGFAEPVVEKQQERAERRPAKKAESRKG